MTSYQTSKIVNEVECLSKVVRRYEKKMEAACGNLIAVAYKGRSDANELKKKSWADIHSHFKQQDWYRMYSDDELSVGSLESSSRRESGRKTGGRAVSFSKRLSNDDMSSIGSSISGVRTSQLMTAERIIAQQIIASSKAA